MTAAPQPRSRPPPRHRVWRSRRLVHTASRGSSRPDTRCSPSCVIMASSHAPPPPTLMPTLAHARLRSGAWSCQPTALRTSRRCRACTRRATGLSTRRGVGCRPRDALDGNWTRQSKTNGIVISSVEDKRDRDLGGSVTRCKRGAAELLKQSLHNALTTRALELRSG